MKTRTLEFIIVLVAAALFTWGVLRAVKRGDTAATSWTTYVMSGLVVLAAGNIAIRSRKLAAVVLVVSALFILLALAAALLSQADGKLHSVPAVIRSIAFFVLLGLAGWIQMHSTRPPADTGQPSAPPNGGPAKPSANLGVGEGPPSVS